MMDTLAHGVWAMTCGGLICSIVLRFSGGNSPAQRMRRMICDLAMVFLALSLVGKVKFPSQNELEQTLSQNTREVVQSGISQAAAAREAGIIQRIQAYILNKAGDDGIDWTVEVELADDEIQAIIITGSVTSEEAEAYSDWITEDLGVERRCIRWNP